MPPMGDLAHNPGMCSDWESNWRSFGSQAGTQPTEPHQPGLTSVSYYVFIYKLLPFIITIIIYLFIYFWLALQGNTKRMHIGFKFIMLAGLKMPLF